MSEADADRNRPDDFKRCKCMHLFADHGGSWNPRKDGRRCSRCACDGFVSTADASAVVPIEEQDHCYCGHAEGCHNLESAPRPCVTPNCTCRDYEKAGPCAECGHSRYNHYLPNGTGCSGCNCDYWRATKDVPPRSDVDNINELIARRYDQLKAFAIEKNTGYGGAFAKPVSTFSQLPPVEQLKIRLDDKLARIKRGESMPGESFADARRDIIGYLVLWDVLERLDGKSSW